MAADSDSTEQVEAAETPLPAGAVRALSAVIGLLEPLTAEQRTKVLRGAMAYLGIAGDDTFSGSTFSASGSRRTTESQPASPTFSEDRTQSPKDFLRDKQPFTDIDRVACLAYYLAHYRDTPHFKTLDISKLNTEAAQIKLSNPTYTVDNAARAGLLVPAAKGTKQISTMGELYVQALPDREAAKSVLANTRTRRRGKKSRGSTGGEVGSTSDVEEHEGDN